jgi:hypothetical protein
MSNTDRIRAYYNLHKKCFSVQDYKTGLVIEHTDKLFVTNAMFVVRKSGNERVKQEGKKNVHAFVNGIRQPKWITPHLSYQEVKYNPHTMDYFKYKRVMTTCDNLWLEVDRHWIGNVWLFMVDNRPCIYADIDKLGDTKIATSTDTNKEPIHVIKDETCIKRYYDGGGFSMEFLAKKRKQIENKKKLLAI